MASPHAACATPCAACVTRPLVLRAPRPPAVSGSGANGAGARAEQGEAPGKPRTAVPANPDRELRGRAALGLPTRRARRAVRYVRRAPARSAHAPGARRSEGEARAKRRNGTAEAEPSDQPAREIRTASSEGARRSDSLRAVRVASRVACAARPLVMRAPPPACGRIKGAPRAARQNERRREEKRAPHARHPCSTAAARTTRDARAPRASRARRPSPCTLARARSARSDDQREGARQGRRPATEEEEKHHSARHPA